MPNKDYLEKIRKAREKSMHDMDMDFDELVDYPMKRIATALEIMAESLISKKETNEKITISGLNMDAIVDSMGNVHSKSEPPIL